MRMEMGVLAFFCHAVAWFFLMAVEERGQTVGKAFTEWKRLFNVRTYLLLFIFHNSLFTT